MEKIKLEVEVAKETYELGQGLDGVVESIQKALADGWQIGTDLPQIMLESITKLVPAIEGIDKMGAETQDPEAFADAIYMSMKKIPFRFIKKSTPVA